MTLDQQIEKKFKGKSNNAIISIINRPKRNIDDETYELKRRGVTLRFDGNKAYISTITQD